MPSISFIKTTAITLAATLAITAAMPVLNANAGGRHNGDIFAAGVIGLALGAIIADSSHRRQQRVDHLYYQQPAYIPPQPVRRYPEPYYEPYPSPGTYYDDSYRSETTHYRQPSNIAPRRYETQRVYKAAPPRRPAYNSALPAPRVITYNDSVSNNIEPWSPGWRSYCRNKFRSFNAKSGTYLGYDGKRHFCVVK